MITRADMKLVTFNATDDELQQFLVKIRDEIDRRKSQARLRQNLAALLNEAEYYGLALVHKKTGKCLDGEIEFAYKGVMDREEE